MRAVCAELGLSRSNVVAKQNRSLDWVDCRRSPPKTDDAQVREAIADVVKERPPMVTGVFGGGCVSMDT